MPFKHDGQRRPVGLGKFDFILFGGADLHDALKKCTGSWTLQETRHNLETFLKAILAR